jgi:hypothetical protein
VIAFMAGVMGDFTERITIWSTLNNPFFAGPRADLLSMIPFVLLVVLLHLVGREAVLRPKVPREKIRQLRATHARRANWSRRR